MIVISTLLNSCVVVLTSSPSAVNRCACASRSLSKATCCSKSGSPADSLSVIRLFPPAPIDNLATYKIGIVASGWATETQAATILADVSPSCHGTWRIGEAGMHTADLLDHALRAAEQLGYKIRQEWLSGSGGGDC